MIIWVFMIHLKGRNVLIILEWGNRVSLWTKKDYLGFSWEPIYLGEGFSSMLK